MRKPTTIRETLEQQGDSRPNLRILTEEETVRLQLPPKKKARRQPVDYLERKAASSGASGWVIVILVALLGAAGGIGLVLTWWRLS